jgi:hypothetical protein
MVPTPGFPGFTQLFSDEFAIADRFFVSALVPRPLYRQNSDLIYIDSVVLGHASLHGPCATKCSIPNTLLSLRGNTDADILDSGPLRCNPGSGPRHLSPTTTCPRLLTRSTSEFDHILRKQCETLHPQHPVNSTVLRVSGFVDWRGATERKQWNGFIERWSHAIFYGGSCRPTGAFTWDVLSPTSSSFREHRSRSCLHSQFQSWCLDGLRCHRGFTNTAISSGVSNDLGRYSSM